MNRILRKCRVCQTYTLGEKCPKCGSNEIMMPHPPKFSPDDRYLRYRVQSRYDSVKTQEKK